MTLDTFYLGEIADNTLDIACNTSYYEPPHKTLEQHKQERRKETAFWAVVGLIIAVIIGVVLYVAGE